MTFEELGAALRSEREKRNLRVEDAANKLKINQRLLRAIENGDIQSLPHAAYVKGFIRSYASWLGFSTDEIQQSLASLDGMPSKPVKTAETGTIEMPEKESPHSHAALYAFIILLLCGALCWWLWSSGQFDRLLSMARGERQPDITLQTADHYLAEKDADNARKAAETARDPVASREEEDHRQSYVLPVPGNTPPDLPARPQKTEEQANPEQESIQTAGNEAVSPVSADSGTAENMAASDTARSADSPPVEAAEPDHHNLLITAIEECWIHSNADKTDTRQFSLRKGDTFALTFTKSLELKLGNAGGVRLRYDGEDLPPPGSSGQVRTIVFPPKERQ